MKEKLKTYKMNILITGGAGFIGKKLVSKLSKKHSVLVIDLPSKIKKNRKFLKNCKIISGDVTDKKIFDNINCNIDVIYHLAALCSTEMSQKHPKKCFKTNVFGTQNIINWSLKKKIKQIIFTSSMAVYGKNAPNVKENLKLRPLSIYGKSKFKAEKILLKQKNKVQINIFRLFNVYGPGQDLNNEYQGMFSIYLKQILDTKNVKIKGDLNRVRDFVYIDDVIKAITSNYQKSLVLNVGTGKPIKVIEVVKIIFKTLKIKFNNNNIHLLNKHSGDTMISYANIKKICKLGWKPKYSFTRGAEQTIKMLSNNKWI